MTFARKIGEVAFPLARDFVRRQDGGPASEFAMIMPLFAGLVFVIAQVGLYFYYSASLYYVTQTAARQIMVGNVANQGLTAAQFQSNILCPLLPGAMSCNNVITNIQIVPEGTEPNGFYSLMNFASTSKNSLGYTMTGLGFTPTGSAKPSYCIGMPGAIVAVEVFYAMPVLGVSSILSQASTYNGQSVIFINATAAFKNEPFTTSYTGC